MRVNGLFRALVFICKNAIKMLKLSSGIFICENAIKNAETVISGIFSWKNAKNAICVNHMTHNRPIIFTLITYSINNYVFTYFSKNLVINYQDYELRIIRKY